MENSNITLELRKDLEKWINILFTQDKDILSDIPYSFWEIQRELTRRDNLDLN